MTEKRRRTLLFAALTGALVWSLWLAVGGPPDNEQEDTKVADVVVKKARPHVVTIKQASPAAKLADDRVRLALEASTVNLFPKQTWYIPPPPPPPPPPQAPALPFIYMGRWVENGKNTYYLTRGAEPLSVSVGQVVDGVWRLEPVRGASLDFTYTPLNQTRSLRMGD